MEDSNVVFLTESFLLKIKDNFLKHLSLKRNNSHTFVMIALKPESDELDIAICEEEYLGENIELQVIDEVRFWVHHFGNGVVYHDGVRLDLDVLNRKNKNILEKKYIDYVDGKYVLTDDGHGIKFLLL